MKDFCKRYCFWILGMLIGMDIIRSIPQGLYQFIAIVLLIMFWVGLNQVYPLVEPSNQTGLTGSREGVNWIMSAPSDKFKDMTVLEYLEYVIGVAWGEGQGDDCGDEVLKTIVKNNPWGDSKLSDCETNA